MTATVSTYLADLQHAAAAKAWYAALALGLALPDICGKIEYPSISKKGERYSEWCNTYIHKYDANLIGEDLWTLRCAFLHTGTGDLKEQNVAYDKGRLANIILTVSESIAPAGVRKALVVPGFKSIHEPPSLPGKSDPRGQYSLGVGALLDLISKGAHDWQLAIATDRDKYAQANDLLEIMPIDHQFPSL